MIYIWSILLLSGVLVLFAGALILAERRIARYGTCRIAIDGRDEPIQVEGGGSLIDALREGGIHVPSMCGGQGTCGYCRVTITSGGGPLVPTELLYLSREQLAANVRLACQVKVRGDMRLALPGSLLGATRFESRVVSVLSLTPEVKEIRLRLVEPERIAFSPGQYVEVEVPFDKLTALSGVEGPAGQGEVVRRAYSIASPVYESAEIALDVHLVSGGAGSTWLHSLQVDDVVHFTGPYGEFRVDEDPSVALVCVAGGCGVAPMKSIIYDVLDRWPDGEVWLFYGCRAAASAFHKAVYDRLAAEHPNFHFHAAVESAPEGASFEVALVHELIAKHLPAEVAKQAFLSGPEEMMNPVTRVLTSKGVVDVHGDAF